MRFILVRVLSTTLGVSAATGPARAADGPARVTVESSHKPVALVQVETESVSYSGTMTIRSTHFRPMCTSPCTYTIDPARAGSYALLGHQTLFRRMQLDRRGPTVKVEVLRAGNSTMTSWGVLMWLIGATGIAGGAALIGSGVARSDRSDAVAGGVVLAMATGLFVPGVILHVRGRWKVRITPDAR